VPFKVAEVCVMLEAAEVVTLGELGFPGWRFVRTN
jgi:hypothetical protein